VQSGDKNDEADTHTNNNNLHEIKIFDEEEAHANRTAHAYR
jgi:hypothetical protein